MSPYFVGGIKYPGRPGPQSTSQWPAHCGRSSSRDILLSESRGVKVQATPAGVEEDGEQAHCLDDFRPEILENVEKKSETKKTDNLLHFERPPFIFSNFQTYFNLPEVINIVNYFSF